VIGVGSVLLFALIAASVLTGSIRRYALTANLLDIPNQRSSHTQPTPRGGGVAIVIVFLFSLPVLAWMGLLSAQAMWAFWGAGACIALIGFLDDHQHIPARWRLLAHFTGASWGLFWLGGLPPLEFFGYSLDFGWFGHLLGLLFLVWLINLYNFMDGIDGLAGIEAITVCLGSVLVYLITDTPGLWEGPALLSMSVAGFLLWNFPPAKIFMGDAGSGFLGMVLGLMSLQAAKISPEFFWCWIILLGVFIVDATWTLFHRILRGEKIYQAHRSHAYQYASRYYGAHRPVSLAIGLINLCWLTPLALAVGTNNVEGVLAAVLAYVPLILLMIKFKAGAKDQDS
jgi:Fuc2NAc and GlcNAc transferase